MQSIEQEDMERAIPHELERVKRHMEICHCQGPLRSQTSGFWLQPEPSMEQKLSTYWFWFRWSGRLCPIGD